MEAYQKSQDILVPLLTATRCTSAMPSERLRADSPFLRSSTITIWSGAVSAAISSSEQDLPRRGQSVRLSRTAWASALFASFGPSLSVILLKRMPGKKYATLMMSCSIVCGVAMLLVGSTMPFVFWTCFMLYAVIEAAIRPFAANLLLEQQEGDAGSVSSLYNFVCTVLGSVGTAVIMLPWPTYISGLGLLIVGVMGVALVAWSLGLRTGVKVEGI